MNCEGLKMEVLARLPPIGCLLMIGLSGSLLPMWLELSPVTEKIVFRWAFGGSETPFARRESGRV